MHEFPDNINTFSFEESGADSIKLLLVDDKPENLYSLEQLLCAENKNVEFLKCTQGEEALKIAIKEEIALILLDVQMPGMDGYEVARFLKSNPKTEIIPIIFVTANNNEINNVLSGFEVGAVDFLFKPLNPQITKAKVNTFVKLFEKTKKLSQVQRELQHLNQELEGAVYKKTDQLNESQNMFAAVFENAAAGIAILSPKGIWLDFNTKLYNILGYTKRELLGTHFSDILFSKDAEDSIIYNKLISGEVREHILEKRYIHKNGSLVYVNISISSVWKKGVLDYFIAVIEDITAKKKGEVELRQSETMFRALADSMPQMIWCTRPDGYHDYYNQRWYDFVGKAPGETEGEGWNPQFHPDDQERAWQIWGHSLKTGEPYEIEYRLRHHDGNYKWVLGRALPMKNEKGEIIRWFGTCTDIQKQKDTEAALKESEAQWKESANNLRKINNDLDNFIYTASHDLKAPITNIEGLMNALSGLLLQKNCKSEKGKLIEMINTSINRFKKTILDLTEVSKVQRELHEDIELVSFKETTKEIKADLKQMIDCSFANIYEDFQVEIINFSKRNFRSIIYNLLSNAIKYKHSERRPEIKLKTYKEDEYVVLSVSDNGLGVNDKQYEKIFGMFKRLHNHVEGSGIGLYIVKRNIENTGGKIEVESEIGKGTTFKLFFKQ